MRDNICQKVAILCELYRHIAMKITCNVDILTSFFYEFFFNICDDFYNHLSFNCICCT